MKNNTYYVNYLKSLIEQDYLAEADLIIKNNKSDFDSIIITAPSNLYRGSVNNMLGRIKLTGKAPCISFRDKYKNAFIKIGVPVYESKSDTGYFRIGLDNFFTDNCLTDSEIKSVISQIFVDTLCFPSFGCCSKYLECSDAKKCIHDDKLYSTSCMYRKNLESGKIFYGKNQNINR